MSNGQNAWPFLTGSPPTWKPVLAGPYAGCGSPLEFGARGGVRVSELVAALAKLAAWRAAVQRQSRAAGEARPTADRFRHVGRTVPMLLSSRLAWRSRAFEYSRRRSTGSLRASASRCMASDPSVFASGVGRRFPMEPTHPPSVVSLPPGTCLLKPPPRGKPTHHVGGPQAHHSARTACA